MGEENQIPNSLILPSISLSQLQSSPVPTHAKEQWRWRTKRVVYGQNRDGLGGTAAVNPYSHRPVSLACNQERNDSGSRG
ncbi:hypothetical protein Lal_00000762 [Lupinus albus]|uniref:Uncharacterized protein n=1 Tax=Lupinus albus TaxID=3870 RepID=A0A6A5LJV1_LUPAL|nr:hypothetical protein Lalb_Chr24g0400481 [Lupinus albus]KAF1858942.1 hypothetical protein Lal_00000762 [Lupinus albus]